jgi:hypothetical protein
MKGRTSRAWPIFGVLLAIIPCGLRAQSSDSGAIVGRTFDSQQAALPGVGVSARNLDTGLSRSATSGTDGFYRLAALPPGRYDVSAELSGFRGARRTGVTIAVASEVVLDLLLEVGGRAETVTVEAEAPLIDRATANVGGTLAREQLERLPTISRDFRDFLRVVSGSAVTSEGVAFFGSRPRSNNWLIDGADNTSEASGLQEITPQLDSIAEFRVLTNNFKAEFGHASGGVINAVTRSGTNALHGSAFAYFRNEDLRARSPFESASQAKPPFERLYAGGTLGGPVRRDKLFFFAAYQRQEQDVNQEATYVLPPSTAAFSPATLEFLSRHGISLSLFGNGGPTRFVRAAPSTSDKGTLRLDYQMSPAQSLSLRYAIDKSGSSTEPTGTLFDFNGTHSSSTYHDVNLNHKWVSGQRLNEAYLFYRHTDTQSANDYPNLPIISIPDLVIGGNNNFPQGIDGYELHLKDHFSWLTNRHQWKAGAEARIYRTTSFVENLFNGMYVFPNTQLFLLGRPVVLVHQVGRPDFDLDNSVFSAFLQDDWRPSPRLTLSLGVRYDYQNAKVPELVTGATLVSYAGGILPQRGKEDPAISDDKNNLAPRFGFVWTPDEEQAIYGGTGIYFDQTILNNFVAALFTPPRRTIYQLPNPPFPDLPTSGPTLAAPGVSFFDPDFRAPRNWNTTIGYRRELGKDLGLDVSFIRNRGKDQQMRVDANPGAPGSATINGAAPARPVTNVGSALRYFNGGIIRYTGLRVDLTKRMSHHVQGGLAYTLGRQKDNSFNMITAIQVPTNPELNYGPGNDDVRHRLVAHTLVELPWGFELAGIAEFRTEAPLNLMATGLDLNGDGITGDWINEKICVKIACPGLSDSRNSVRELSTAEANRRRAALGLAPIAEFQDNPRFFNVDASLRKQFTAGKHSVTVFVEAFNAFNIKQYTAPVTSVTATLFGRRTSVVQPRTLQLGVHYKF